MPESNHHIKKVLKTYTTEEIKQVFNDIEACIENLIHASSNDFMQLNNHFKNFYNEVNNISGKSSEVFKEMTDGEQERNLKMLSESSRDFEHILHSVDYQLQKSYAIVKNITKNTNLSNLHIKNFKQNLKTLKFVITNLKIVSITSESNKNINEIDRLLKAIDSIYPCFDNNFMAYQKLFSNSLQTLLSLKEKSEQANRLLSQFTNAIQRMEKKLQEAMHMMPVLNENTNKCSEGLSNIITNLQYQDIVKQKIDHVRKVHRRILDKLGQADKIKRDEKYLVNKAKLYVQISDISGLQSAQLLHANQDYQQALSNITNRFIEIADLVESISALSHDFFEHNDASEKQSITQQMAGLNTSQTLGKELQMIIHLFELQMESLISKNDAYDDCYAQISTFKDNLNGFYKNITQYCSKTGAKRLSEKNLKQIEIICSEMNHIASGLDHIKNDNDQLVHFLQKEFNEVYPKQELTKNLNLITNHVQKIVDQISYNFKNSYNTLLQSLSHSAEVSAGIKASIDDVQYYNIFEEDIERIIQILNEMNNKLKIEDADAIRELKDLEGLRKNYTMSSEHDVHNQYSAAQTENNTDVFDDNLFADMQKNEDEDDNLELF